MGAIFGWIGEPDAGQLDRMHQRLGHRGSDCRVLEGRGGAMLAAAAASPAHAVAADARYALVLDGRPRGPWNPADTDTPLAESVLEAIGSGGAAATAAFGGNFALALWDGLTRTLVLARDLVGVQPLFYTTLADGGIAFASEYKALMALAGFDATLDRDALQRLHCAKYLPMSGGTLFRSVRSVPPGTVLTIGVGGEVVELARAGLPPLAVAVAPRSHFEERIAQALLHSTGDLLRSAGRVGVALSGGVDSVGVAFACRRHLGLGELTTFTAGSGPEDPEVRTAALVSARLGAQHRVVTVGPQSLAELLPQVIWHLEAPIARSETLQFYEIGRSAAGLIDTMVTGAAADALYAGMPNYKLLRLYERLPPLRRALHEFHSLTQTGYEPHTLMGRVLRQAYFGATLPALPQVLGASFAPPLTSLPAPGREFLNSYLHAEFQADSAQWLPKIERTLAASGVDFATPFLHPETVRVAFTVPERLKIRGWREKYVLREALRSIVDADLTEFEKFPMRMRYDQGFADALDELADEYLSPQRVRARGLFALESVAALRRYRSGGRYGAEGAMRLWTAVGTEIWAEHFLDRAGEAVTRSAHARPRALASARTSHEAEPRLPRHGGDRPGSAPPRSGGSPDSPCVS